jgi:hypothetical protein
VFLTALWAGPLVALFTGDCPARRSGLERRFFCLENENRVWYTQEISLVAGVGDESLFRQEFQKMAAREGLRCWYASNQRAVLASVIWHLCKQPVGRFGKNPLNQRK